MTQTTVGPPWQRSWSQPGSGGADGLPGGHAQHSCGGDKALWPRDTDGETEARRGGCRKATHMGWEGRVFAHTDQVSVFRCVPWQPAADAQCHLRHPGVAHLAAICHARRAQVSRRSCVTSASPVEMSQGPQSFLNCTRHLCRGPG